MSVFREGLLAGKVAFVTGGGSGIGAGIAKRLAEQGARIAVMGRRREKLDEVASAIASSGGEAVTFGGDVREYDQVHEAITSTVDRFGRLDIVINSAAGNFPAPAATLSPNGFRSVVAIDLLGTFNVCRAAFEQMNQDGGSIVNISAPQAWVPMPLQVHVGAAKAGIEKLTKDLAIEWGAAKIRVNSVVPGPTADTEGMRRLAPADPASQERLQRSVPLGRFGEIREIAEAVLFLCSDAATYVTGATLTVDGGWSLMGGGSMTGVLT
jgi:NAD(P)-dependent dehydrogenase (short-subunit alcohol dehydrogenase family)